MPERDFNVGLYFLGYANYTEKWQGARRGNLRMPGSYWVCGRDKKESIEKIKRRDRYRAYRRWHEKKMPDFALQDAVNGFDLNKTNSKIKCHNELRVSYEIYDWDNLTKVPYNGTEPTLSYYSPHVLISSALVEEQLQICS